MLSSTKFKLVVKLLKVNSAIKLFDSNVVRSLSIAKLYFKSKNSIKLFDIEPNIFDVFLFKVVFFGIKFSSLSLKTVANLNSKNLFTSSISSFYSQRQQ